MRKVYRHLEDEYGEHPLCTREIFVSEVDKRKVFTRGLDDAESRQVIEALTKQPYFEQIIGPFLTRIDYDEVTNLACGWHIARSVVVDPAIFFGKPTVEGFRITTRVLAASYLANAQNARAVADWFQVDEDSVRAAVEFESGLAA